jgi:predicted nucleic acid-binding protein
MTMPNNLFVDTSGWAYYLDRQDPLHAEVAASVRRALTQRRHLVTTSYIICELVALLSSRYHLPRQQVIKAINAIKTDSSVEVIYIERSLDDEAWNLLETRLDKEWSLVDASSFVVMKHYGLTEALTTDHHFTQAGFVRSPKS